MSEKPLLFVFCSNAWKVGDYRDATSRNHDPTTVQSISLGKGTKSHQHARDNVSAPVLWVENEIWIPTNIESEW